MMKVTVPLSNGSPVVETIMAKAMIFNAWCNANNLAYGRDFTWLVSNEKYTLTFVFFDHCESMATLFALRWA